MTSIASATSTAEGLPRPTPRTIILRGRALHPLADTTDLSRFGDDVWFTTPADVDNPKSAPSLNFTRYPQTLRVSFKTFALAALDHDRPEILLSGAPGEQASLGTIYGWLLDLRLFADWLDARQVRQLRDVTAGDLDIYRAHVTALSASGESKAGYLHAVRALWAYRENLPIEYRLPGTRPWGSATARNLVGHTAWNRYNKTPRIHPDTMDALLAWALRVLEDFGPDIRDAFREDRQLMDGSHPTAQFYREHYFSRSLVKRLERFLPQLRDSGRQLPGQRRGDGTIEIACGHLSRLLSCDATHVYRQTATITRMAGEYGVTVAPDAHLGTITGRLHGTRWRNEPIGLTEIADLVRHLRAASFTTICYLSGMRPAEVLQLRRGCLREDDKGQLTLIGHASKGLDHTDHNVGERSWAVVGVVGTAITMLESLTDSPLLFPPSTRRKSPRAIIRNRPLRNAVIDADITRFIDWVNTTFSCPDGKLPIPPDPTKLIHASRFRRTLAYFVVRRPGGLIAAALQYGHVRSRVTLSYAGEADTSWLDDVLIERLEMVIDQTNDDLEYLHDGEHISGPSAEEYRRRLDNMVPFAGRVVDKVRNVERLLDGTDPSIHHGRGMTCVYRAETALCRMARLDAGADSDGPDESDCRSACTNLAYTNRDIEVLQQRLIMLEARAVDPLSPRPLRDRSLAQAARTRSIIERHEHTRPGAAEASDGTT
ncbi:hypothetical protein ACFVKB_17460 [Rhodococcus sp. NPDC127530]|uniref:hypothetical protein n=1 Tax=unclassified Rhodococcus (in: high G+C Gram-positive bacteria) TaxID=192944 RepID=UPI0036380128